jgi:hypothetical protein
MAQSPIDIPMAEYVTYDSSLKPFTLNGFKNKSLILQTLHMTVPFPGLVQLLV